MSNARSALLFDIEQVQENLADIHDQQCRTQYAKIFAHTELLRIHHYSSKHHEGVAHFEHLFDWTKVVQICDEVLPDIEPALDEALSTLTQQGADPKGYGAYHVFFIGTTLTLASVLVHEALLSFFPHPPFLSPLFFLVIFRLRSSPRGVQAFMGYTAQVSHK